MKYQLQKRLFHLKGEFWIEDETGSKAYQVDGRMFSSHLDIKDVSGSVLTRLHRKMFSLGDTMEIHDGSDRVIATVSPAFLSPTNPRYEITRAGGPKLAAVGGFSDRSWALLDVSDGHNVGTVTREGAWAGDSYWVEVTPGADAPLVLSIAICMDRIHEDEVRQAESRQVNQFDHPGIGGFGGQGGSGGPGIGGGIIGDIARDF